MVLGIGTRILCMLGQHSTNWRETHPEHGNPYTMGWGKREDDDENSVKAVILLCFLTADRCDKLPHAPAAIDSLTRWRYPSPPAVIQSTPSSLSRFCRVHFQSNEESDQCPDFLWHQPSWCLRLLHFSTEGNNHPLNALWQPASGIACGGTRVWFCEFKALFVCVLGSLKPGPWTH